MSSLTPNLSLIKPGVADPTDEDLWGGYLNDDMDIIDAALPLTTKGDLLTRNGTVYARLPVGANGQALVADSAEATGLKYSNFVKSQSFQNFTADGTWTKPAGLLYVKVTVVGGGGGGSSGGGYARPGAGGGMAVKYIQAASLGATETVTVGDGGAGGAGGVGGQNGSAGETSSFGAHCSATGGAGGLWNTTFGTVAGGTGSGGDINLSGQNGPGYLGNTSSSAPGGASPFMSGGGISGSNAGVDANNGQPAVANSGSGGGCAYNNSTSYAGGAGGSGIVIVEQFIG
jgi:hypothetical protein